ncbi:MAG TPA: hypothetical protein VK141_03900 [Nitrosomonas sp.]|nr:hypothetical protein [Nitrosomonas sp.]
MRKYQAIDLMKLYSQGSTNGWNEFLTDCYKKRDINRLGKMRYSVQAGMDDLAKKKLNTDEINAWFCRIIKSIELTAKRIIKIKHPLPGDNPLIAKKLEYVDAKIIKQKRDQELAKFMAASSY